MIDLAIVLPLVLGAFGACIGSFLNVVIYRLPREELSIRQPSRSFCPHCKRSIPLYENVPILSWFLLGGRCRGCKAEIPLRYLLVEVATAFLFAALGYLFVRRSAGTPEEYVALVAGLGLAAACVAVTFIDFDWKIIPDEITWPGMALGVIVSAAAPIVQADSWLFHRLVGDAHWERHLGAGVSSLTGLAVGALSVLAVGVLGKAAFRKEAMGLGDVKFMGMVGAFLGFDGVLLVFFLGCVAGAIGGLVHKAFTGDRYIAFGPYLSLGVLLVLFFRAEMFNFLLYTWPATVQGWFHGG